MSLRAFHIVFILLSVAMSCGLGIWGVTTDATRSPVGMVILGIVGFAAAGTLTIYGIYFQRKIRRMGLR